MTVLSASFLDEMEVVTVVVEDVFALGLRNPVEPLLVSIHGERPRLLHSEVLKKLRTRGWGGWHVNWSHTSVNVAIEVL